MIDAGSTGSRVHVFRFEVGPRGELNLIDDTFEQLKPGLSSFAKEPEKEQRASSPYLPPPWRQSQQHSVPAHRWKYEPQPDSACCLAARLTISLKRF